MPLDHLVALDLKRAINRLLGIVPTFDTFDTNPSNPERMTDGDLATETGEGVETVTVATGLNRVIGNIMFDMGAVHPVWLSAWINMHRHSGDGNVSAYWMWLDGAAWRIAPERLSFGTGITDYYRPAKVDFVYARKVGIQLITTSVTIDPSVFHVKVAEVMALELI